MEERGPKRRREFTDGWDHQSSRQKQECQQVIIRSEDDANHPGTVLNPFYVRLPSTLSGYTECTLEAMYFTNNYSVDLLTGFVGVNVAEFSTRMMSSSSLVNNGFVCTWMVPLGEPVLKTHDGSWICCCKSVLRSQVTTETSALTITMVDPSTGLALALDGMLGSRVSLLMSFK